MANASSTAQTPVFDMAELVQKATQATEQMLAKSQEQMGSMQPMINALSAAAQAIAADPQDAMDKTVKLYQQQMALGANMLEAMMGRTPAPVVTPAKDDKRFNHEGWNTGVFDVLKQSYLMTSTWLQSLVADAKGMDAQTQMQAAFYTRQLTEMMSPSNFVATNPEVIATAVETKGESLMNGLKNLLADVQKGGISMTDTSQFEVGKNIGVTPGEVVFKNKMVELIQYKPQGDTVQEIPLLISPPWINRFYILDLQAHNSLVNYLVGQGFQVFMISWKNPDASYRDVTFEDYIKDGFLTALGATLDITGAKKANVVGYCIGGTLTASAVAVMNAKKDDRINSVTFLTSLVDFKESGELNVFIDEPQVQALEAKMQRDGILNGKDMAATFSALRASDLIWNFVINNYLLGKAPFPFDILYWNGDSTCMPAAMHSYYLRNMYMENNLIKGKLTMLGTKVDVKNITQPVYMLTGMNDHITPWTGCYSGFNAFGSKDKRFVLSRAGHVAGVVNPPTPAGKPVKKTLLAGEAAASADVWLKTAKEIPDSWWPDYAAWLKPLSGDEVKAPKTLGNKTFKPLYAAPGTYVKEH